MLLSHPKLGEPQGSGRGGLTNSRQTHDMIGSIKEKQTKTEKRKVKKRKRQRKDTTEKKEKKKKKDRKKENKDDDDDDDNHDLNAHCLN